MGSRWQVDLVPRKPRRAIPHDKSPFILPSLPSYWQLKRSYGVAPSRGFLPPLPEPSDRGRPQPNGNTLKGSAGPGLPPRSPCSSVSREVVRRLQDTQADVPHLVSPKPQARPKPHHTNAVPGTIKMMSFARRDLSAFLSPALHKNVEPKGSRHSFTLPRHSRP
ncbi:hypothetical protein GWK47_035013 [Chionoecetes opilio]|uniref:Uncharacterized protein n=1 Tax=Chionoecetes opilio TaxID=41210 RepID=A0A8J4YII7_CHIOP|nr:hypothetical protein GWK47_035013 [Chionoecetes opilio]